MRRRLVWVGLMLLVAAGALAGPVEYAMQTEHFRILYPEGQYEKAEVVAQAAEAAIDPLCGALDIEFGEMVEIRLFTSRTEMFATFGAEPRPYVMGLALPKRSQILLGVVGDDPLARTTTHELAHIMLYRKFGSEMPADQPRWLHEGVAQIASAKLSTDQGRVLGRAAVGDELMDIEQMELAFAGTSEQVALAYAQAYTLVQYLHHLRPEGGIAALVSNLSTTGDLDRAFIRTYGRTKAEIEATWLAQTRTQYLSAGIPLSGEFLIFGAMAVLFIVAVVIQSRRRAAIRLRLQEEEELHDLLDQ